MSDCPKINMPHSKCFVQFQVNSKVYEVAGGIYCCSSSLTCMCVCVTLKTRRRARESVYVCVCVCALREYEQDAGQ